MKTQKSNKEKKSQRPHSFRNCGDFQKMAEMMKACCPGEGDVVDCCSMMKRMMGDGKEAEGREAKKTQKAPKGREKE